jgi:hypothetical protein
MHLAVDAEVLDERASVVDPIAQTPGRVDGRGFRVAKATHIGSNEAIVAQRVEDMLEEAAAGQIAVDNTMGAPLALPPSR